MFDKAYLSPAEALQRLLSSIPDTGITVERLRIEECYNRVIAADVIAPEDLPAFSRSTVDGYALIARDTFGAKDTSPAYINVRHEIMMGTSADFEIKTGEAAKIPTGGMMPEGADAVLMLEHAQAVSDDMIEAMRSVAPGENVIQKGEDIQKGKTVLTRGHKLRSQDIGALAGIGVTEIEVFKKPSVSIISTGDEIVPASSPLKSGQVRDINSFTLAGLIGDNGGVPVKKGIFKDDYGTIKKIIEDSIKDSDMVLISGGTSAGTKDMTADIINDIARSQGGAGVVFHGLSLKPGKPMIGGIVNNKPIMGLPGHPAAVVVCFNLFIKPMIERLGGFKSNKNFIKTVTAKMAKNIASAAGREDHIRVYVEAKDGELLAVPVLGKSGLITTLVKADGIVIIPQNKLGLEAGEEVMVRMF
ncbi:MAG: molybdopterin molybdotransferase MoeA [Nitrospirae bacterium]|nr:molybdopterin molybdotransferase MoeA [Nitrospirota bacterium]MCL5979052.1 molybdopterin molybdotransferase MoeA [Nitrospirota bacterium]